MLKKVRPASETLALVRNTLQAHDPEHTTVTVGSAAMMAQIFERSSSPPLDAEDVDVLCSQEFFDNLLRTGPFLEDDSVAKFQVRWPKGRLRARGATNKSIDILPAQGCETRLGFTACYSMSDLWFPIDYESCQSDVVEASGIRCLRIGTVLKWIAIVGRDKDIETVEAVLPVAQELELVGDAEADAIITERNRSVAARTTNPDRYYARTDIV